MTKPENVFVIRMTVLANESIRKALQEEFCEQIARDGILLLPVYCELQAVTGPCTDVKVIVKQAEEDNQ